MIQTEEMWLLEEKADRLPIIERIAKGARRKPCQSERDLLMALERIEGLANPGPLVGGNVRPRYLPMPDGKEADLKQEAASHYVRADGTRVFLKSSAANKGLRGTYRPEAPEVPRSPIVIGLGTGRCGTKSLARLLRLPHEAQGAPVGSNKHFRGLWKSTLKHGGDVGYYWLPWVEEALKHDPDIRFVCIEREKEPCVMSLMRNFCMTQERAEEYWCWHHRER